MSDSVPSGQPQPDVAQVPGAGSAPSAPVEPPGAGAAPAQRPRMDAPGRPTEPSGPGEPLAPAVPAKGPARQVGPRDYRISDADREKVAGILHQAAADGRLTLTELDERLSTVYSAKTYGELEPVTDDLPVKFRGPARDLQDAPAARSAVIGSDARVGAHPGGPAVSLAILGGADRKGEWTVPPTYNAISVMGGVELDFCAARYVQRETAVHVFALMGGVQITVPEDVTVTINGIGIMGGFDHRAEGFAGPDAPVLRIDGVAIMGGVEIRRKHVLRRRDASPAPYQG